MPGAANLSDLHYTEATILFADVVESVRMIERDEARAVREIVQLLGHVVQMILPRYSGTLIERRGDGLLLMFSSPAMAASCAKEIQQAARGHNAADTDAQQIHFRIGIHRAEVLTDDVALYGHGVNLAARITALAGVGETVISAESAGQLLDGMDGDLEDLGDCHIKHVGNPVHLYRITWGGDVRPGVPMSVRPIDLHPSIAVIPFTVYAAEADNTGIGDIIADQLIGALSRSNALTVISRLSTNAFRGRVLDASEVASRLASNFLVTGKFSRKEGQLLVHVEVVKAAAGKVIWAETVRDHELATLHTDSELIGKLLRGIAEAIFAEELRTARTVAFPNLESHTLLLAAISLLYRLSAADFERARDALYLLHERAPRHPAPLAWLARWHLFRVVQGWSDDRDGDGQMALSFANRALDLDPASSLALTMAGNVHTNYLKDLAAAERLYDAALAANPNDSLAWLQKGNARSFSGDGAGALQDIETAIRLSPLDPSRHFYESLLAGACLSAGSYERAIVAARSSLRLNQNHVACHRVLAIALSMTGELDAARATVRTILELEPNLTVSAFIARSPGRHSGLAEKFGRALLAAGLPAGNMAIVH